jgi:regulator of protease activity HflC (stomatin/prohibitin superfamily)
MLGIRYLKAPPTAYILYYSGGRLRREGPGLSFFYYSPSAVIASVPLGSRDQPFALSEVTSDFQTVTVQGQITYRVRDPRKLSELLDFTIHPGGTYRTDDPELLSERLVHAVQVETRAFTQRRSLREVLTQSGELLSHLLGALPADPAVTRMGVEILGLSILQVQPSPDMARALEAQAREALQREADLAIYGRRNAAVENERMIKENELSTEIAVEEKKKRVRETQMDAEIAVEEKKRKVRETQMAADIAVEEQRQALLDTRGQNERKEADSRAYALETTLGPLRGLDWKTLLALSGSRDPRYMIAVAFRELAENAQKIGELNVTPDLLDSLLRPGPSGIPASLQGKGGGHGV